MPLVNRKYFWIAVDGTDGVGKTTVSQALLSVLRARLKDRVDVIRLPEFSQTAIGDLLRKLVQERQFVRLEEDRHYVGAETALLIGDLFAKIESCDRLSKNTIVISDRGLCSLIAYQRYRYDKTQNDIDDKKAFDKWLESSRAMRIRHDTTVLLTLPVEEIIKRLKNRGDMIDADLADLITHTQEDMRASKEATFAIDCMNKETGSICLEIFDTVEPLISEWLRFA